VKIYQLMQRASEELVQAGIKEGVDVDVQLLLCATLNVSRTELLLKRGDSLSFLDFEIFSKLLKRRINREPVAYILGKQEFWSLDFFVSPAVLIPRPETEFLLEQVISHASFLTEDDQILDLCTGSGAIAVVLAKELKRNVVAVDISTEAIEIAEKNSCYNGVEDLLSFIQGDLFSGLPKEQQFGLIVSNPPYIPTFEVKNQLEPEVYCYEPNTALDGGEDGLDLIKRIRDELPGYLRIGGMFFMEFGADQGEQVKQLFSSIGADGSYFTDVTILKDYAGRDRVLRTRFTGF